MNFLSSLDPIAARTLVLLVGFFAAAGVGVFATEKVKKTVDPNLRQRYFSWYIIAPAVLLPAYFGGPVFAVFVAVLSFYALREYLEISAIRQVQAYKWLARVLALLVVLTTQFDTTPWFGVSMFYLMPVFVVMSILTVPIFLGRYEGMLMKECATIFGVLYFGWILAHLIFLRQLENGFGYLVFLSVAVVLNDVLAYTTGRLFGKHKLAPDISPKKTWEGAFGGLWGSILGAVIFKYAVPSLSWPAALTAGVIIGVTAPLGDLVVSVIKRDMAVKDSGQLIPGHGGLLDRCDSLIFATPAFYYFLLLAQHQHF
jgi:phosphatidate cytidylyltransferase